MPTRGRAPVAVVDLDDPAATDPGLVGAKAANLARARAAGLPALPGTVLTTAWRANDRTSALTAWRKMSQDGTRSVVVRSSSTGEDGASSSMAGVFESVLDVEGEGQFLDALDVVLASADAAREAGLVDAPLAVLVQPMVTPGWGGVIFGADPVTGRRSHLVVAAAVGGAHHVVSGEVTGWTAVLDRRGHVRRVRSGHASPRPPQSALRRLARMATAASRTYGRPQDIEWSLDAAGRPLLLQARPITSLPVTAGAVYGPGPLAETFPDALSTLEQDLWIDPLRDGLREALRLAGVGAPRAIERSDLVVLVDGSAAADLGLLGLEPPPSGVLARLDLRPPARRLRAAWRVGRLRSALPGLAEDIVHRVDRQLAAVPALDELSNSALLALLRNGRQTLVSLHGHESLTGLLIPQTATSATTGASLALASLAQARAEGLTLCDLIERDPVVLALVPPRIGPDQHLAGLDGFVPGPGHAQPPDRPPDPAALAREALRLRIRWVQELTGRAAWELGRRLVDVGVLPSHAAVRLLRLDELADAVHRRRVLPDLGDRREPAGAALPARFGFDPSGQVTVAAPPRAGWRRRPALDGPIGAGGGTGRGPVHVGRAGVPRDSVLVVTHLDPRLAPIIPDLAGLVAETGSPLSHLAILAREHHVPVVVGLAGATTRFADGDVVTVDGEAGAVLPVDAAEPVSIPVAV